jgi:hypothetical protein
MKLTLSTFLVVVALGCLSPRQMLAQELEPVLESYSLARGGTRGAAGLTAVLFDKNLGNGTATAHIVLTPVGDGSQLSIKVMRRVGPGEIAFALLVFRVEIRAYNAERALVYSRDLDGFTFGDSSSGRWFRRLKDLPPSTAELTITFVGNYE